MNNILVIEDDDGINELIALILRGVGYNVSTSNKTLPIGDVISINPDLILLDHYIANTLGGDYCLKLKSNPETEHIPILLVSAATKLKEISENAYADGYILKPFDVTELEKRVERAILR